MRDVRLEINAKYSGNSNFYGKVTNNNKAYNLVSVPNNYTNENNQS
jgi:hypothetical protein